tara:strand:+ start:2712 stop:3329 length:618 start_codon:yes stop_codon:yes gene_type:complete
MYLKKKGFKDSPLKFVIGTIMNTINFGKYKNQQLSNVFNDTNYKNWLIKQSFFKKNYPEQYKFLINYKPLSKINFDDLPCDIKSMIYSINYNSDPNKLFYESQLADGWIRFSKKGWKKILPFRNHYNRIEYSNCGECGARIRAPALFTQRHEGHTPPRCDYESPQYENCRQCFNKISREFRQFKQRERQRKKMEYQLQTKCLISE